MVLKGSWRGECADRSSEKRPFRERKVRPAHPLPKGRYPPPPRGLKPGWMAMRSAMVKQEGEMMVVTASRMLGTEN